MSRGDSPNTDANAVVVSVSRDDAHRFSKAVRERIRLLAGLGVEGDAHAGVTVKHRSRVARDPTAPNLRQAHLIDEALYATLNAAGFHVGPGDLGENVMTRGIDLLNLPRGTRLRLGATAMVEVTGLRNPCAQIEAFEKGLLAAVLGRDDERALIRKAGVMGIVVVGGELRAGDLIRTDPPPPPHARLEPV